MNTAEPTSSTGASATLGPSPGADVPRRFSKKAIASLVLALCTPFLWVSPFALLERAGGLGFALGAMAGFLAFLFAIILGHVALSQIKKSHGSLRGKVPAVLGLVLAYLYIVPVILWVCLILFGKPPRM